MSVFSSNMGHRSFYWQINGLCFVLGLLLAAACFTVSQIASQGLAPRMGLSYPNSYSSTASAVSIHDRDEIEIKKLEEDRQKLLDKLSKGSDAAGSLDQELRETRLIAGLTEVTGPGVQVTLVDSQKKPLIPSGQVQLSTLIHDTDVSNVVNELKIAGAEAIAVNGQRIAMLTSIRCVGPVIQVNGNPTSPPYVIQAIGDPDSMYGGLNLPLGVLDGLRQFDPNMVRMAKEKNLHLPAYVDITHPRFARPVESSGRESKSSGTRSDSR